MTTSNEGKLVPVVLLPRFTTLLGDGGSNFETLPLDLAPYEEARITLWRSAMQGTGTPALIFYLEESTDRNTWTACEGTSGGVQINANEEFVQDFSFRRKWFRLRAHLQGTHPAVTCFAQGLLVRRQR